MLVRETNLSESVCVTISTAAGVTIGVTIVVTRIVSSLISQGTGVPDVLISTDTATCDVMLLASDFCGTWDTG